MDSLLLRNPDVDKELVFKWALDTNEAICNPPLPEKELRDMFDKQCIKFTEEKIFAKGEGVRTTSQDKESPPQDSTPITITLELVEEKKVDLFLDEVKTPYALVRVNGHLETIPIRHQNFEDWVGALYYRHNKEQGHKQVLSKEMRTNTEDLLRN